MSQHNREMLLIEQFGPTLGRAAYDLDRAYADPSNIDQIEQRRDALSLEVSSAFESGDAELSAQASQVLLWLRKTSIQELFLKSDQELRTRLKQ